MKKIIGFMLWEIIAIPLVFIFIIYGVIVFPVWLLMIFIGWLMDDADSYLFFFEDYFEMMRDILCYRI